MFLTNLLKKHFPKWNKVIHTEDDAREFCKKNKVCICETTKVNFGKYTQYKGYDFILINPKLSPAMRLWVLWHEIAHFLLHSPETSNFSQSTIRKNDREANWVAAILLMPKNLIKNKTRTALQEEYGYLAELIEIRKYIIDNEKQ